MVRASRYAHVDDMAKAFDIRPFGKTYRLRKRDFSDRSQNEQGEIVSYPAVGDGLSS